MGKWVIELLGRNTGYKAVEVCCMEENTFSIAEDSVFTLAW